MRPTRPLALAALLFSAGCAQSTDSPPSLEDADDSGESRNGDSDDSPADGDDGADAGPATRVAELTSELAARIDGYASQVDFTLIVGRPSGTFFEHGRGSSTSATEYESASTSKLVTSVVILSLVERGYLTLDSHPQDFIAFWTADPADGRSQVTLRQLLSFTSGLHEEPFCVNLPFSNFAECVESIYELGPPTIVPGSEFYYSSSHMQVAGLMAHEARGVTSWSEVFDEWKALTGLFPGRDYDLPSITNPRLAGGMHWTGNDYMEFLRSLFQGSLLTPALRAELFADRTAAGVEIVASPVQGIGEGWHYALGNWIECRSPNWLASCASRQRYSSPGAYGAYPFLDFGQGIYGIVSQQGPLGSFRDGGYDFYVSIEPLVIELAGLE